MSKTDWTEYTVANMLATDDAWMKRALVMLYHRQLEIEKFTTTIHLNDVGFQVADAVEFSALARKIIAGQDLSTAEISSVRKPWNRGVFPQPRICKYRKQVLSMIRARENG